ncbi:MAG: Hsp20/alpha crystallin family protein [Deltaproteobacteria bacterium]|nr:Hsp20/alpha crystallin family protein [Deltaproteobacteria bacterium]
MILRRLTGWPSWGSGWNPFGEIDRIRQEMNWLSDALTRGFLKESPAGVFPLMNLTEDKDNYYVRAEMPGIRADDLDISVTEDSLSISGERKLPAEDENATYHRREREAGKFSRMVTLPGPVDTAKVDARCSDGILTVLLPKAEAAKPKQITVKAS